MIIAPFTLKPKQLEGFSQAKGLREQRVAELKRQVEQGSYRVASQELADRLLGIMLQDSSVHLGRIPKLKRRELRGINAAEDCTVPLRQRDPAIEEQGMAPKTKQRDSLVTRH